MPDDAVKAAWDDKLLSGKFSEYPICGRIVGYDRKEDGWEVTIQDDTGKKHVAFLPSLKKSRSEHDPI